MTFLGVLRHRGLRGACLGTRSSPVAPTPPPAPFPGALPLCLLGRWGGWARGACRAPAHRAMVGLSGRLHGAVRKAGAHQIRLWALPVTPPPQAALLPSSPSPAPPQAGVLRGMNFTTRSLWFHYEFPDPGQHPQARGGPPLPLSGQEASLSTLRQQQEAARAALGKDFPTSQMTPVVPGGRSWSQEACPALSNSVGWGPAEA